MIYDTIKISVNCRKMWNSGETCIAQIKKITFVQWEQV